MTSPGQPIDLDYDKASAAASSHHGSGQVFISFSRCSRYSVRVIGPPVGVAVKNDRLQSTRHNRAL